MLLETLRKTKHLWMGKNPQPEYEVCWSGRDSLLADRSTKGPDWIEPGADDETPIDAWRSQHSTYALKDEDMELLERDEHDL